MSGTELERLIVRLQGDATSYHQMLSQASADTTKMAGNVEHHTGQVQNFSSALMQFAAAATAAMGLFRVTNDFAEFDQAMTESTSIMVGLADEQKKAMKELALEMSGRSSTSAKDLAKSYYYLASAGLSVEQQLIALPIVQRFAVAGAFDMARATDLLGNALNTLGMKVDDTVQLEENMIRVTGVLARVTTLALGTTQQYAEGLTNDAGSAMRFMNRSVEEGVAVLGVYSDSGKVGRVGGAMYGRALRLLGKAAVTNAEQHKRLGFAVFDNAGRMRNMADIVQNLEGLLGGMSDRQRVATMNLLGFKALQQKAITPLIGYSEKIRRFQKELEALSGTDFAKKVFTEQMASFSNQIKIIWNNVKRVSIEIGQVLAPAILRVAEYVRAGTDYWLKMDKSIKKVIIFTAVFLAGLALILPLLSLIGPLFGALLAPLSGIAHGVLHWLHLSTILTGLWNVLVAIFSIGAKVLMTMLNPIRLMLLSVGSLVLLVQLSFAPWVTAVFTIAKIAAVIAVLVHRAGGLEQSFHAVAAGLNAVYDWLAPIGRALMDLGKTLVGAIVPAVLEMGEHLITEIEHFIESLHIDWEGLFSGLQAAVVGTINLFNILVTHGEEIGHTLAEAWGIFISVFQTAGDLSKSWAEQLTEGLNEVGGAIIRAWDATVGWLSEWISKNHATLLTIGVIVGAILVVITTVKLAIAAVGGLWAAIVFLKLNTLAAAVAMGVWKLAVLAFSGVMAIASASLAVYDAGVAALSFIMGLFTASEGGATVATWLLNMALAVLSVETIVPLVVGLTAAVLAFGAVVLVVGTLAAAVYGVYKASEAFLKVLSIIPTTSGPLKAVTDVFSEWWEMLQLIVKTASVDMNMAWHLVELGANLAVSQIKDLWPPLWAFIKGGFMVVWETVSRVFYLSFLEAINSVTLKFAEAMVKITGGMEPTMIRLREEMEKTVQTTGDLRASTIERGLEGMGRILDGFQFEESDRTKEARRLYGEAAKAAGDMVKEHEKAQEEMKQQSKKGWKDTIPSPGELEKNIPKLSAKVSLSFDFVGLRSAEAMARINEFQSRLRSMKVQEAANPMGPPGLGGGGGQQGMFDLGDGVDEVAQNTGKANDLLKDIRDSLRRPGLQIEQAGLAMA